MGMAACLAVLAAKDVEHGPLEVLLTIDEEAGMTGAFGLEEGWLEGDILLNTDSEQEGRSVHGLCRRCRRFYHARYRARGCTGWTRSS